MQPKQSDDYDEPVAYDKDGRPLYAHPPLVTQSTASERPAVKLTKPPVNEETARRHDESKTHYPSLNLSESEYVAQVLTRHWIGLVVPVFVGCVVALLLIVLLAVYPLLMPGNKPSFSTVALVVLPLLLLDAVGVYIPVLVYRGNRLYLTNESVILDTQISLFARDEQVVSLGSIEDVSFQQSGAVQLLFGFGTIELSTNGEDHYRFTYVKNPKAHVNMLNDTIESFKNAREVSWS